jgi:hypothetical protein
MNNLNFFLVLGNESKKELKKFELNIKEMSEYSVVNKIWSLIEENNA